MATQSQRKWEERVVRAVKLQEDWMDQFKVELGRQFFEGNQNPGYPEDEWITVNKIYSHLQAQLPTLYSVDPYFYVKLKKSFTIDPEEIVAMEAMGRSRQAMLNYLKIELKLKQKARMGIQDAHFAFGVIKTRRASELTEHPSAGKPVVDEDNKPILDEETGEQMIYPNFLPVNEHYEISRVHPNDFIFDEDAGPLPESWSWVGQRIQMKRSKALKDKRFSAAKINAIKGKSREKNKKRKLLDKVTNVKEDDDLIDFWEIYDLEEREWLIMAEGAESLMIKPRTTPPGIERMPFSILRFTLRDDSPYPIPPVFPALDPQKEFCLLRSQKLTHRKRFNRKYEVDVNKLLDADTAISKLEAGDDGTIIEVQAIGAIVPIKDAPLDQQNILEGQAIDNDIVEAFGTPGSSRGVADADSATEASLLDKRLGIREGDRMSIVIEWILEVAESLDKLVQFHITGDEALKIIGPEGENWTVVREEDYEKIQGEFAFSVNVGASQARLPEIERSQWIAFLSQVVIPFPAILTKPNLMRKMAEMFGIEDDATLQDLKQLGEEVISGQVPAPGNQGGGPASAVLGQALGPSGGNTNGGGSPLANQ